MPTQAFPKLVFATATLRRAWVYSFLLGLYSCLAVWIEEIAPDGVADHPAEMYVALSMVLGLLLVFRTNSAYERWWEARTLWGRLVNVSRNLAVKVRTLVRPDANELQSFGETIASFADALKSHLRSDDGEQPTHRPAEITIAVYRQLDDWRRAGLMSDDTLRVIDSEARELLEVCGGCERISKTPLSKSYPIFLHQCVLLLLFTTPWILVDTCGYWTILITFVEAYFMLGVEAIAQTIEEPFGTEEDDLDLDGICRTIRRTVGEITEP